MGGAFTGLADDPTAVYYNPAGIVQLDGTQISLGFAVPIVTGRFESNGTSDMQASGEETDMEENAFFIPNFYTTHKLNDRLSLGVGEYTIYGLGFEWPDDFEGRFSPAGKRAELQTMGVSAVAAYKITDQLSIGAGGRLERAYLELDQHIFVAPGVDEVQSEISGDDYAPAWQAALFYTFSKHWRAGLSYRSETQYSFDDMDVKFSPQIAALGPVPVGLTNTKARMDITLPQFASLGLAWSSGPLTLTFDLYWWEWSKIDNLNFRFKKPVAGQSSLTVPMNWKDTWSYAVGAEYIVTVSNHDISLRAGFMYEESPVPDETVNPAGYQGDNLLYNIGAGSKIGPFIFDIYSSYVETKDRDWNNVNGNQPNFGGGPVTGTFTDYGTYIFGSNLTYKF
jgi:long-chain fatty acid transport protein